MYIKVEWMIFVLLFSFFNSFFFYIIPVPNSKVESVNVQFIHTKVINLTFVTKLNYCPTKHVYHEFVRLGT